MGKKRSILATLWTTIVITGFTMKVLWCIFWTFGKLEIEAHQKKIQRWALDLLKMMNVNIVQHQDALLEKGCLRAANHVSWLDIVVLYACSPCRFIAKSEVSSYPLVGRIARNAGTLFLKRGSIKDAVRMSEKISEALQAGDCVAFFPEGTTSLGHELLPMHSSLFEGAIQAQGYVQSVVLRFHTSASTLAAEHAAYVKTSLLGTLWHILRVGSLEVSVTAMTPFQASKEMTRQQICARVEQQMKVRLLELNRSREDVPLVQHSVKEAA